MDAIDAIAALAATAMAAAALATTAAWIVTPVGGEVIVAVDLQPDCYQHPVAHLPSNKAKDLHSPYLVR